MITQCCTFYLIALYMVNYFTNVLVLLKVVSASYLIMRIASLVIKITFKITEYNIALHDTILFRL